MRAASYTDALTTLDALDAETAKEGRESERKMAEGPLAFLRGVCDAALGKSDEARAQFQTYLTLVPNASIDASMYPKKAVVAFEDARKSLASGGKPAPAEMSSLATSYAKFRGTTPAAPENLNEAWGNGPVRFLMTAEEKTEWSRLSDPVSRSEFVTKFWTSRDLRPETPDNEFRQEFERRVAFADANFSQDEVRGSVTDRGMVFVLVGPPTWVGRKPIRTGEDSADAAGMSTSTRNDVTNRGRRCGAQPGGNRGSHDGPGHPNPGLGRELAGSLALPARAAAGGDPVPPGGFRLHHAQGIRKERPAARRDHPLHPRSRQTREDGRPFFLILTLNAPR